jgi:hypothetical protein
MDSRRKRQVLETPKIDILKCYLSVPQFQQGIYGTLIARNVPMERKMDI